MKQFFIYMTINLIDNKKYIGRHYGEIDDTYMGSGHILIIALKKYGKQNFKREILEICNSKEEMYDAEKKWIKKYNANESPEFYNISAGGENDALEWVLAHPEEYENLFRKKGPESMCIPVKCLNTGEVFPSITSAEIKYPSTGHHLSNFLNGKGKSCGKHPITNEKLLWRKLILEEYLELKDNEPQPEPINYAPRQRQKSNTQPVLCTTTNLAFFSTVEAAKYYNIKNYGNISSVCNGNRKHTGIDPKTNQKLHWKKISIEEYNNHPNKIKIID